MNSSSERTPDFLRVEEVAAILGVDRYTVYRQARRGLIPSVRLGRLWLFPREAIDNWKRPQQAAHPQPASSLLEAARSAAALVHDCKDDLADMFSAIQGRRSASTFVDPLRLEEP